MSPRASAMSSDERKPVHMADVASAAGVALSTVSRALSGNPGVSAQTRARIRRITEELGYVVSPEASKLSGGRTGRVGFVTPTIDEWFYASVIAGATRVLAAHGIDVVLYPVADSAARARFFEDLPARRKVDAIIVIAFPLSGYEWERLDSMDVHAVVVGIVTPDRPSVGVVDESVGRQAVDHLLALGHREIGMITCVDPEGFHYSSDVSREQGFRAALAEAGVAVNEDFVVAVRWGIDGGSMGMSALLALPHTPTAVFAFSDEVAFGALRTLRRAGLSVPEDMSLIGVDDHPMAESMDLTTVAQSPRRQGEIAAELCVGLLENADLPQQVSLSANLTIRRSTTPPRPGRRANAARYPNDQVETEPIQTYSK
ncbi:LacI family DNA-binding transcriptional regulator [Tessaracoccus sp.]|uniref:LacI family DNA-binding transcriptional regulator n=1 Tax=Tessaracoccus sp. TaxID=1971211 RepID=UPI002638D6D3|nr:LacI family DNA-binding transcriptional regulator [Tessaracoccus sp.]